MPTMRLSRRAVLRGSAAGAMVALPLPRLGAMLNGNGTAYASGAPVRGRVIERVKGGLSVDIGVRAFLPGSIADTRPLKNLDVLRGRERHEARSLCRARRVRAWAFPRQTETQSGQRSQV